MLKKNQGELMRFSSVSTELIRRMPLITVGGVMSLDHTLAVRAVRSWMVPSKTPGLVSGQTPPLRSNLVKNQNAETFIAGGTQDGGRATLPVLSPRSGRVWELRPG
jgi:hypothetical protein